MVSTLLAALAAGLVGSPHCAGMCGGFAGACARVRGSLPYWHAGRLGTYMALGALAGAFGAVLPGPAWVPGALSAVLLAWFALSLAGVAPEPVPRLGWLARAGAAAARRDGRAARFAFGVVNGLLPCGMVYAALSVPVAAADPLTGALAMLAFGLGTVPALTLLPAALRRFVARGIWHRRAIALLLLVVGLCSIGARTAATLAGHAH